MSPTASTETVLEPVVRDPNLLARSGSLEARIATSAAEIEAAQRLRYEVFYREMSAKPTPEMEASGRDFDRYDAFCDHLLVFDTETQDVVGCYRLLRHAVAAENGGFYSADEYDLGPLLATAGPEDRLLELGRSCVAKAYRSSAVMQFMWRGLVSYLDRHGITLMFGCASLHGIEPEALKLELAYLHHFHAVPPELPPVRALAARYVDMNLMPKEAIDVQEAQRELPPLVKGYIRFGSYIGDGAVIDHQFNTTDVFIYFPTARIDKRLRAFLTRQR
jgi:putative hemolysin